MTLEKEAYMNKIEADVLDVNQIMQDLAGLINAQAQSVGKIFFYYLLQFFVNCDSLVILPK